MCPMPFIWRCRCALRVAFHEHPCTLFRRCDVHYLGDDAARRGAGCPRGEAQGARSALHGGAATGCACGAGRSLEHTLKGCEVAPTNLLGYFKPWKHPSAVLYPSARVVSHTETSRRRCRFPEVVCRAPCCALSRSRQPRHVRGRTQWLSSMSRRRKSCGGGAVRAALEAEAEAKELLRRRYHERIRSL